MDSIPFNQPGRFIQSGIFYLLMTSCNLPVDWHQQIPQIFPPKLERLLDLQLGMVRKASCGSQCCILH